LKFLSRRRNVTVYQFALSDRNGTGELHIPSVGGCPVDALATLDSRRPAFREVYRSVPAELRRLDDVLPRGGPRLSFVKCDVDGHELRVLKGAEETVKRDRPLLLVEIEQRVQGERRDVSETFRYVEELGYVGYLLGERGLAPLADFDIERDQIALLDESMMTVILPGYVNEFFFVPPDRAHNVAPLVASVSRSRSGSRPVAR
ncbi:MAG: FkbM family methyltransferase, partial [Actinomycetota bacterium]|nr:FkbM family methyltransferase [Actinomycetota bacterium]